MIDFTKVKKLIKEGKTQAQVAKDLGCSVSWLSMQSKKHGIQWNQYDLMKNTGNWDNPEFLKAEHWDKQKSIRQIARENNISSPRLLRRFKKYEIDVRSNAAANKLKAPQASKIMKDLWKDKKFKEKHASARLKQRNIVSNIQQVLYNVLDDLKIQYYRERQGMPNDPETAIGPYNFDCVIPLKDKTLLIECNGDYWHNLEDVMIKDKQKQSYISNNFPTHELKYLWEHEFGCKERVIETIKYWTGSKLELIDFNFSDIIIKSVSWEDYKLLLSKYHYLHRSRLGSKAYGAYINNELVAVCVFSPLVRQNIDNNKITRELSRFCIHPKYQKKNFGSWFISRCIKKLPSKYTKIISYCDTTYNHDGALYKACNFKLDKKVRPDYWYVNKDGWVMHKKTLWDKASKMSMKEKDFAEQNGYIKVWGKEKLKFVYQR